MKKFPGFKKGINLGGWLSQSPLTKEHMDSFFTEKDFEDIASMGDGPGIRPGLAKRYS